jgi:DNA-directed RNA polymerase subunit RPC12/RpoP
VKLKCNRCGVDVSTEVPDSTVVRAWIECQECSEKKEHSEDVAFESALAFCHGPANPSFRLGPGTGGRR